MQGPLNHYFQSSLFPSPSPGSGGKKVTQSVHRGDARSSTPDSLLKRESEKKDNGRRATCASALSSIAPREGKGKKRWRGNDPPPRPLHDEERDRR